MSTLQAFRLLTQFDEVDTLVGEYAEIAGIVAVELMRGGDVAQPARNRGSQHGVCAHVALVQSFER